MLSRYLTTLSLIIILGLVVLVSVTLSRVDSSANTTSSGRHLESYTLNVQQKRYDLTGNLSSIFHSPKILQYHDSNTALIDHPTLTSYGKQGVWHLSADKGKAFNGGKTIHVWGHVVIAQPADAQHPATTITTTDAMIYPHESLAKTSKTVTIKRPDAMIQGVGAIANMKAGTVTLLSQSRGTYAAKTH